MTSSTATRSTGSTSPRTLKRSRATQSCSSICSKLSPRNENSTTMPVINRVCSDSTIASDSTAASSCSLGSTETKEIPKVQSSCSLITTPDQARKNDARTVLQALAVHEVDVLQTLGRALQAVIKGKVYNASVHSPISLAFVGKSRISLIDYLSRVTKYINQLKVSASESVSPGMRALIMAVLYIDRISKRHPKFVVMAGNVHRLYLTAMMTATKVTEDIPMNATFWAKVGGISSRELINLENSFLQAIDYDLRVESEEFWLYHKNFTSYSSRVKK